MATDDWLEYGLSLGDDVNKKEKEWKKAIQTALTGRDEKIASLRQQVTDLQKQLENTLQLLLSKEREITTLENNIRDMRSLLENEKKDSENSMERLTNDYTNKLQMKDTEIEKLKQNFIRAQTESRDRHSKAIHQLAKESRTHIESLENELQQSKHNEEELKKEIEKSMNIAENKISQILHKENKIAELKTELTEVQAKLAKSYSDEAKLLQKLKEHENLVVELNQKNSILENGNKEIKNQIIEKISEVNENVKCETEMNLGIHNDLSTVKNMVCDLNKENLFMKNILMKLSTDFTPEYESIGVQVNINLTDICFEDTIIILKKRVSELTENEINLSNELQKHKTLLERTLNQNLMLREVIKSMKKDKEIIIQEKQISEDEQRINRLEDSVRVLKSQITRDNCGDGIWMVLNEMKDDLKGLKGKTWHKVTKVNPVLQEVHQDASNMASQQFQKTELLQPTVIPCFTNKNLPLQVPKVDDNSTRNRHRRVNHSVSFSSNIRD